MPTNDEICNGISTSTEHWVLECRESSPENECSGFAERDVLKERRSRIIFDPILLEERRDELKDIRKQLQMLDSRWSRCRVRGQVNVNQRPLITGDEWRKLIFTKTIENDWDLWNEKESSEQWHALESIGSLQETGTLGPAPGVAEEGSDEDAYAVEEFLGGEFQET